MHIFGKKKRNFCVLLYSVTLATGLQSSHSSILDSYIDRYSRSVTILEVGIDSIGYGLELAKKHDCTMVELLLGKLSHKFNYNREREYPNLIVLNPRTLLLEQLYTLSRCEHFDIVIVRDIPRRLKHNHELNSNLHKTLELLLKLGDATFFELPVNHELHAFIQAKNGKLIARSSSELYFFDTPKKGLDIPRWSQRQLPPLEKPRYPIVSNFCEKLYIKDNQRINWLKGINLLTFVMLRGICPCDATISRNIYNFRSSNHNDLIIGNIVIQGSLLIAIDINDPRWDAHLETCIKAAMNVFKGDKWRLKDPEQCFQAYREFLSQEEEKL